MCNCAQITVVFTKGQTLTRDFCLSTITGLERFSPDDVLIDNGFYLIGRRATSSPYGLGQCYALQAAHELPLPGTYTGDETWFEAVSLGPPLSLLAQTIRH
jgi:hypothetical protein